MGALAQTLPRSTSQYAWLGAFLRDELAPYRGRAFLVARMVTAATLVAIIGMTFQIPSTAFAAFYTLFISRENLQATASSAGIMLGSVLLSAAWVIVGTMLVVDSALLRFFWVGATLFLAFYAVSAARSYIAAVIFGYVTASNIPVLDSHISGELKVENILWVAAAIPIAGVITLIIEAASATFRRTDYLTQAINERLTSMQELLAHYADGQAVPPGARSAVQRLAMVGTSGLRRTLQRSSYPAERKELLGALISLTRRLVDLGANLTDVSISFGEDERGRFRKLSEDIAEIQQALTSRTIPPAPQCHWGDPSASPLLDQLEKAVVLIHQVLRGDQSLSAFEEPSSEPPGHGSFLHYGTLFNSQHVKFALRGGLAASLCYVIYNALFWPGISTSVITCVVTGLTTIGASHQKQFFRFAGITLGGVVLGMGAQVFVLPSIDSIGAFALLCAMVTGIAAWFATASSRLSYFGVQLALGFYLVNLQDFKIQTSLAVARDRVVGVLLGLTMMWITFDLFWGSPAGVEMKKTFVNVIRLLAQFTREPISADHRAAVARSYALRAAIDQQFDRVRALADGVLFEFGPSRHQDLALRDEISKWQPQLRTLFLMRISSAQYRLRMPGFELPEAVGLWQQEYDHRSADILNQLADRIEGKPAQLVLAQVTDRNALEPLTRQAASEPQIGSFVTLVRDIDRLTSVVAGQILQDSVH